MFTLYISGGGGDLKKSFLSHMKIYLYFTIYFTFQKEMGVLFVVIFAPRIGSTPCTHILNNSGFILVVS